MIFECSWKSKVVSIIINLWMFLLAVSFITGDLPGTTKMIPRLWCSFVASHLHAYNVLTLLELFVSKFTLVSVSFFGSKTRDLQALGASLKKKVTINLKWKSKLHNCHKRVLISSPIYILGLSKDFIVDTSLLKGLHYLSAPYHGSQVVNIVIFIKH